MPFMLGISSAAPRGACVAVKSLPFNALCEVEVIGLREAVLKV